MSRVFDAPRRLVFDAYTKCEYLKRWLGVFGGWSLDVCSIDLKVGGSYRYGWRNVDGTGDGREASIARSSSGERIVATEKFDESWYQGEAVDTTTFIETDGKTILTTVEAVCLEGGARRCAEERDGGGRDRGLRRARRAARAAGGCQALVVDRLVGDGHH